MTDPSELPAPPEQIIPAKMSRIERLMTDLENYQNMSPDQLIAEPVSKVIAEARKLILDLLGLSEKLQGESIYEMHLDRISKVYGDDPTDLRQMIGFVKRWIPDCWPATENGQVPFARALVEALIHSAEMHLRLHPNQPSSEA